MCFHISHVTKMTIKLKTFWIDLGSDNEALLHHANKRLEEVGTCIISSLNHFKIQLQTSLVRTQAKNVIDSFLSLIAKGAG